MLCVDGTMSPFGTCQDWPVGSSLGCPENGNLEQWNKPVVRTKGQMSQDWEGSQKSGPGQLKNTGMCQSLKTKHHCCSGKEVLLHLFPSRGIQQPIWVGGVSPGMLNCQCRGFNMQFGGSPQSLPVQALASLDSTSSLDQTCQSYEESSDFWGLNFSSCSLKIRFMCHINKEPNGIWENYTNCTPYHCSHKWSYC